VLLSYRDIQNKPGLTLALLLMLTMTIATWAVRPVQQIDLNPGLIAGFTALWHLPPLWNCTLNLIAIACTAMLLILMNKRFALLRGSSVLYASVFLIATGANPWIMQSFSSTSLLALITTICMWELFSCYDRRNATQRVFALFSILSIGSMLQYAFLLVALAFAVGLSYMRVLRLKEFLAMLCGLAAPYWVCLGSGIVQLHQLEMPRLTNIFVEAMPTHILLAILLYAAIGAIITVILTFLNYNTVFATNGQIRGCNGFLNALGFFLLWFMIFDYNNIVRYIVLLNITSGFQVAHYFNTNYRSIGFYILIALTVAYITIFIYTLYG